MDDLRPSKKQRELLNFITQFIKEQGYGPSYREIMRALDYKSVSTVAIHIDGLIAKGLLRKTDHSARSLEIVNKVTQPIVSKEIETHIASRLETCNKDQLELLIKSFKLLELTEFEVLARQRLVRYE